MPSECQDCPISSSTQNIFVLSLSPLSLSSLSLLSLSPLPLSPSPACQDAPGQRWPVASGVDCLCALSEKGVAIRELDIIEYN
jgi:hypothetical protein